jgi:hypothetical protein
MEFYLIVTVLLITRRPASINYKHFSGSCYEHKTESIVIFTFMVPCIVIHKMNKTQRDAILF